MSKLVRPRLGRLDVDAAGHLKPTLDPPVELPSGDAMEMLEPAAFVVAGSEQGYLHAYDQGVDGRDDRLRLQEVPAWVLQPMVPPAHPLPSPVPVHAPGQDLPSPASWAAGSEPGPGPESVPGAALGSPVLLPVYPVPLYTQIHAQPPAPVSAALEPTPPAWVTDSRFVSPKSSPRALSGPRVCQNALHWITRHLGLLAAGLALLVAGYVRIRVLPYQRGYDLIIFAKLVRLGLNGQDPYAIPTALRAPWAYLPLCWDLYLGTGLLATIIDHGQRVDHLSSAFVVLAKLPVVCADLAVGVLIYSALRRHGHSPRIAVAGLVLFVFNPLIFYNSAFYGRFDSIALAFLLLALDRYGGRWFAPAYALAISAKTFPLFYLPVLAFGRDRQSPRRLLAALLLVPVLALPFILTNPGGVLSHMLYDRPPVGKLSWYSAVRDSNLLSPAQLAPIAHVVLLCYPLALLAFARKPLYIKLAAAGVLFVVMANVVYEQYVLWPLPFLILVYLHHRDRAALVLYALLTTAGLLENEFARAVPSYIFYRVLPIPSSGLNIALAVSILLVVGRWLRLPDEALAPQGSAVQAQPAAVRPHRIQGGRWTSPPASV